MGVKLTGISILASRLEAVYTYRLNPEQFVWNGESIRESAKADE